MGELEKNDISKPHDGVFKETFSNKEIAQDFIVNNLPEEVLEIIDIESMKPSKDSFINEELKETFSDLIYTVNINGRQGYLSFLLEHKSYADKRAIIQVAKYILEIWMANVVKEGAKAELTVVFPIVVYHGSQKEWNYRTDVRDMIPGFYSLPSVIQEMLPVFRHELINIQKHEDQDFNK